MNIGGCLCFCHPRGDAMVAVTNQSIAPPCPRDSRGRTTSGGAGEGEHRGVSVGLRI